ncbi:oligosaccharide flippase family protein [Candidatus Microgenomates bacterium]|nr:oligosaccharide flippase family protein [Candidatus Microgenomates bacterium]
MLKILEKKNSVFFVMVLLLVTKVLGFLKLRIIAQLFGVSHELDIFWAAFTIPDMLFMVVVAGSINAAIIPIFSDILYKKGEDTLNKFFNQLTYLIIALCTFIAIILFIFTPQITTFLIHSELLQNILSFSNRINQEDYEQFVYLTRVMMISPILLGISTLVTGYLQVRKQFFITSLAPLIYNIAMVFGPIFFVTFLKMGVEGIAFSAVLGSLLHFVIQIPTFYKYYKTSFSLSIGTFIESAKNKYVWKAFKLAIPRMIAIFGEQVNVVVNTLISFSLAAGALSAYKFALSLHIFPVNIIGSAVAQVALPNMAQHSEDRGKFQKVLNNSIQLALYLVLPIIAILIILRLPIIRLAYGTGAFDWRGTVLTAWCLALLALSVLGQTLAQILLRAFYALKDTWLPLIAISVGIILNIVFAFLLTNFFSHYYDWRPILEQMVSQVSTADGGGFLQVLGSFVTDVARWSTTRGDSDMGVGGLSLSLSIAYFVQAIFLGILLNKKWKVLSWKDTVLPALIKVLNSVLMCIGMYFVFKLFDFQLDTTRTIYVIILTIVTSIYGVISYWVGSKVFNIKELEVFEKKLIDLKESIFPKK